MRRTLHPKEKTRQVQLRGKYIYVYNYAFGVKEESTIKMTGNSDVMLFAYLHIYESESLTSCYLLY